MEKNTTHQKIDWRQFFISVLGTAIGVALTFVVSGLVERRNKAQAQRLTAIMVIHDIDNTIDILKAWKNGEEDGAVLLLYAMEHKDQKEPIPSDTLTRVLNLLVRNNSDYHFDTSKEQIFNSDLDTWQNLGNMKFIDNVQSIFYNRQHLEEAVNTEEWFCEPIPSEEYLPLIMGGWQTQEEYDESRWSFLRNKLHDKRVAYYINVSYSRTSALNEYIDKFTLLNEENKFIMGITDQELEDYVNSITNKGIALNRTDLPGHWRLASKEQNMEYDFHSDNSYTFTNEISSSYMKTLYWSGSYTVRISYGGTWSLQKDSLVMTPDFASGDLQLDASGLVAEEGMEDSLNSWINSYKESSLEQLKSADGRVERYSVKALLDSSRDKMEWTESDGTVRYLKR